MEIPYEFDNLCKECVLETALCSRSRGNAFMGTRTVAESWLAADPLASDAKRYLPKRPPTSSSNV